MSTITPEWWENPDGFVTWIWGPPFWFFLHFLAASYPDTPTNDDIQNMYKFLSVLSRVLPCCICRENLNKNSTYNELYLSTSSVLSTRSKFEFWLYRLHGDINVKLGKTQYPGSFNETVIYYRKIFQNSTILKCDLVYCKRGMKHTIKVVDLLVSHTYEKPKYNSNIWGPCLWKILHIISLNLPVYPSNNQQNTCYKFIKYLTKVLPCDTAKRNMTFYLKYSNFTRTTTGNRCRLFWWTVMFHNYINILLQKPVLLDFSTILYKYEQFRATTCGVKKQHKTDIGCDDSKYTQHTNTKCVVFIYNSRI